MSRAVWNYADGETGPRYWSKGYPSASGLRQSPIDICPAECQYDELLSDARFSFKYNSGDCATIVNSGQAWRVDAGRFCSSTFQTSFLPGEEYKFQQFHSHWGTESHNGSEHTISGLGYAGEAHIVHYNTRYGSFQDALNHDDGLLVLGIFLDEGIHNEALEPLVRMMDRVTYKGEQVSMPNGFDIESLLPENKDFWTYDGSLTTPPCTECVTWIVFRNTISISRDQLDAMRNLHTASFGDSERNPETVACNARPVQPLNDRIVRSSFLSRRQQL